jgi:hypothetical protein
MPGMKERKINAFFYRGINFESKKTYFRFFFDLSGCMNYMHGIHASFLSLLSYLTPRTNVDISSMIYIEALKGRFSTKQNNEIEVFINAVHV